jgi:hypothetical protein
MKNPSRQPMSSASRLWLSSRYSLSDPMIAPNQYVPLTARSTRPRYLAGISSSIAGVPGRRTFRVEIL